MSGFADLCRKSYLKVRPARSSAPKSSEFPGSRCIRVLLRSQGHRLTVNLYFSGSGSPALFTAEQVLRRLMQEEVFYLNAGGFERFVRENGYVRRRKRARIVFQRLGEMDRKLRRFLESRFWLFVDAFEREMAEDLASRPKRRSF